MDCVGSGLVKVGSIMPGGSVLVSESGIQKSSMSAAYKKRWGGAVCSPADALALFPAGYSGLDIPPIQRDILPTDQPQKSL